MNQQTIWTGLVCLLAGGLMGCLHDPTFDTPYQPPKVQSQLKKKAFQPLGSEDNYGFESSGKRDPFIPLGQRQIQKDRKDEKDKGPIVRPKAQKPRGPLQRFGLDAYRLKAVISGTSQPMAVVVDPEGNSHIVRRGDAIGPDGRIARILARGLVISSTRRTGKLTRRQTYRLMGFGKRGAKKSQQGYIIIDGRKIMLDAKGQIKRKTIRTPQD